MKKHYLSKYETGDIVFTCIGTALFGQISTASQSWCNHVGIIIGQFLGSIPWDRKTVTPASLWLHPNLELISACGIESPQREAEGE